MSRFVSVTIKRDTAATSQAGFGTVLLLGTSKVSTLKRYTADTAIGAIGTDFGASSEEYKLASRVLGQNPKISEIATLGILYGVSVDATPLIAALNSLILTDNDFYYVMCPIHTKAVIQGLSEWIDTQDKLYLTSTDEKELGKELNSENTVLQVHNDPSKYPGEGWGGAMAPRAIGTATWRYKTIAGIAPATYNSTDVALIEKANGNTYIREGGVNITSNGVTTSGEWIDIVQTTHYLKARAAEAIFSLFVRLDKIPYDQSGLDMVETELSTMLLNTPDGMLARDASGNKIFSVYVPPIDSIPTNNKANRLLQGVKFRATIAGAIEKVEIEGTMEY